MRIVSLVRLSLVGLAAISLAACDLEYQSSPLVASASSPAPIYTVEAAVEGHPPRGRQRALPAGSHLLEVGRIAEGAVYKPRDTVLTVEAINIREADIVVRDGIWVGFWTPVEKAFVPMEQPVPIRLRQGE